MNSENDIMTIICILAMCILGVALIVTTAKLSDARAENQFLKQIHKQH
jgi:nitrate reductase gamma subunit